MESQQLRKGGTGRMIPRANITAWRNVAPWPTNEQIEQDLVLSRIQVGLFNNTVISENLVFRGGTALHKFYFKTPGRYSEDIDLVQLKQGSIGELADNIHDVLDSWLGSPEWKQNKSGFTLSYQFLTSYAPTIQMKVKIEINTREHFSVMDITQRPFTIRNPSIS